MSRETSLRRIPLILAACAVLAGVSGLAGRGPGAEDRLRESQVCLDCHGGLDTTLARTVHHVGEGPGGAAPAVFCTDCHSGSSRHWEEDPIANPMTHPAKVGASAEAAICATCHQNAHQQSMLEKNVHAAHDVSCSGCHRVHGTQVMSLLHKPQNELCMDCHARVEGQFARPFHHPVEEGIIQCSECHASIDRTSRTLSFNGTNDVCTSCHGEFAGPFPFEHQATLDHSTEEGGCLTCHDPHGSSLPRMLKQPYEPPHFQLCTQCHSVPRHFSNAFHGTQWAGLACNDCHTDVHGSYDNRLLVNESLRDQGCLVAGCHGR